MRRFKGNLKVGVLENLPADVLVGNNMLSLPKAVSIVICSKKKYVSEFPRVSFKKGKEAVRGCRGTITLSAEISFASSEKRDEESPSHPWQLSSHLL